MFEKNLANNKIWNKNLVSAIVFKAGVNKIKINFNEKRMAELIDFLGNELGVNGLINLEFVHNVLENIL